MATSWEWEILVSIEFPVNTILWESMVLMFVSLHLSNKVHKMLWLLEEFELLGINQVAKFILDLDNHFDGIETVQTMIGEKAVKLNRSLLGSSEIALDE